MHVHDDRCAEYRIIVDEIGSRYRFFCQLSGALICTTAPIRADTQEEELKRAWETEGKQFFNKCQKCGRWVCDLMYNPDKLECVDCSPWMEEFREREPVKMQSMAEYGFGIEAMKNHKLCKSCGRIAPASRHFCSECGRRLPRENLFQIYG